MWCFNMIFFMYHSILYFILASSHLHILLLCLHFYFILTVTWHFFTLFSHSSRWSPNVTYSPALRSGWSAPRDQIDSDDYPYLVCGYPSNHVKSVSYDLGMCPDITIYKWRGTTDWEPPNTFQSNQSTLFTFSVLAVDAAYPPPPLFDSTSSRLS
jgi:hypothetical protein